MCAPSDGGMCAPSDGGMCAPSDGGLSAGEAHPAVRSATLARLVRRATGSRFVRDERGQSLPLLLMVMVAVLGAGVLVFWLALSTNYATVAQTGADATALAAEKEVVREEALPPVLINGVWVTPQPNWNTVRNVAIQYATDNDARLDALDPQPNPAIPGEWDVEVVVSTAQGLPAQSVDASVKATAAARASNDPVAPASTPTPIPNDASLSTGPRFVAHGGTYGFFPNPNADFSDGSEPEIAGRLDGLGIKQQLHIVGLSGSTSSGSSGSTSGSGSSTSSGASSDANLHACGAVATVSGLGSSVTDQQLKAAGLERFVPNTGGQSEEIALTGTTSDACDQDSDTEPTPAAAALGNSDVHLVPMNGGPQDTLVSFPLGGIGPIGGPWVIPTPIVMCESGGQNLPPNSAGASGYYQIIPSTWKLFGGIGPAAYLTSKAEQDLVATRIWNNGAGASNWDCASMVHWE